MHCRPKNASWFDWILSPAYAPRDIQDASDYGSAASLIRVANLDQLHGDGPHALSASGFDVVVVRTPAGLRAFEGRCPHQGTLLGEGDARRRTGMPRLVSRRRTTGFHLRRRFGAFARAGSDRGKAHIGRSARSERAAVFGVG